MAEEEVDSVGRWGHSACDGTEGGYRGGLEAGGLKGGDGVLLGLGDSEGWGADAGEVPAGRVGHRCQAEDLGQIQ
ncbi:hypothetical protein [Nonomuraea sp. NPDC003804]|uniref:hypothetical protein n=1 Tax=Nonomuraea sp. NPDC003804 TaxID=3154547 RepID=UPI0033A60F2D